ncbi:MAG: hypothetical protein HDR02_01025 [Lachnospiraceae bacterium]|nr:hypothetical protein [Lachnospiraceae bacterium]
MLKQIGIWKEEVMGGRKTLVSLIFAINIIGVICLIYFGIPYITHDTTIAHPDAMLPAETWDGAGMTLTFGSIPLLVANVLIFLFVKTKVCKISIFYSECDMFYHSDKLLGNSLGVGVEIPVCKLFP